MYRITLWVHIYLTSFKPFLTCYNAFMDGSSGKVDAGTYYVVSASSFCIIKYF